MESRVVEEYFQALEDFTDEKLGSRLRKARKEAGLTQKQVGEFLGKSHASISDTERAVNKINVIELIKLAVLYQKPLSFFFESETESK